MKNLKYICKGAFLILVSSSIVAQTTVGKGGNPANTGTENDSQLKTTTIAKHTYAINYKPATITDIKVIKVIDLAEEAVFFEKGESKIREISKDDLHKVADALQNSEGFDIIIEGHADRKGSEPYNYELAEKRAENVYDFLVAHGVNDERLKVKSYGDNEPIRKKHKYNRRVEFHFAESS